MDAGGEWELYMPGGWFPYIENHVSMINSPSNRYSYYYCHMLPLELPSVSYYLSILASQSFVRIVELHILSSYITE